MDRLPQLLIQLLECAEARLSTPVCRAFIHPGPNAVWDNCEVSVDEEGVERNGQLWVAHLTTVPNWPVPTGLPSPCPTQWAAQVEVGTARCQQGKLTDDLTPPDPDLVTADAALQQVDRNELLQAILCCWGLEEKDLVFDRWESFEPLGGCVVNRWLLRVRIGTCRCDDVQS